MSFKTIYVGRTLASHAFYENGNKYDAYLEPTIYEVIVEDGEDEVYNFVDFDGDSVGYENDILDYDEFEKIVEDLTNKLKELELEGKFVHWDLTDFDDYDDPIQGTYDEVCPIGGMYLYGSFNSDMFSGIDDYLMYLKYAKFNGLDPKDEITRDDYFEYCPYAFKLSNLDDFLNINHYMLFVKYAKDHGYDTNDETYNTFLEITMN